MTLEDTLIVIPARGGSKGIPGKNIKLLAGRPLLHHTLEAIASLPAGATVCVSTDDGGIADCAALAGFPVPFLRPRELATDTAGTYEVLIHALDHYLAAGKTFSKLLLLQVTSPFRQPNHIMEALALFESSRMDMVVSVTESEANPYYNLFEESDGVLVKSKPSDYVRRQDCPPVYQYNGAIYVIDVAALRQRPIHRFRKVAKYVMDAESSLDLDAPLDWMVAEMMIAATNDS